MNDEFAPRSPSPPEAADADARPRLGRTSRERPLLRENVEGGEELRVTDSPTDPPLADQIAQEERVMEDWELGRERKSPSAPRRDPGAQG